MEHGLRAATHPGRMPFLVKALNRLLHAAGVCSDPGPNRHRHASWFEPSTGRGYVEDQSGVGVACLQAAKDTAAPAAETAAGRGCPACSPTLAHVSFSHASDVAFVDCDFTLLGGVALRFDGGAHDCGVFDCTFRDISGARCGPITDR